MDTQHVQELLSFTSAEYLSLPCSLMPGLLSYAGLHF